MNEYKIFDMYCFYNYLNNVVTKYKEDMNKSKEIRCNLWWEEETPVPSKVHVGGPIIKSM